MSAASAVYAVQADRMYRQDVADQSDWRVRYERYKAHHAECEGCDGRGWNKRPGVNGSNIPIAVGCDACEGRGVVAVSIADRVRLAVDAFTASVLDIEPERDRLVV